ncbi:RNA polymerase sigma-70 factor [Seonamhaeicola sp.]|uniref:RNA polymerase sigma factor n=1 Tax=Seonamhaeicola sp. TaxID=1912245 RepID=UPI00261F6137|nr:RNA polymerase sigma-70 factor [Seonamhaeicola sp.]
MKTQYNDDISLIKALKNEDPDAYSFLLRNYHHKLCVYAFSLTNDNDFAEDVVQNVFINIWRRRSNLKDDFSLKNYLYKSVYNEYIDQHRKQKSILSIEKKYIDGLSMVVESEDESYLNKLIEIVKREIENLPPRCKETFLLSRKEGLTNIEIAEYLNISVKGVEFHLSKAFKILRNSAQEKVQTILFLLFGNNSLTTCTP